MLGSIRPLAALALALCALLPIRRAEATYQYQPFGDLPDTMVVENRFASELLTACDALTQAPQLVATSVCPAAAIAPPVIKAQTLAAQIASARTLPPAGGACVAQAQVDMIAVVAHVNALKATCGKLRSAIPSALVQADLDLLREALGAREILAAVDLWKKAGLIPTAFATALAGSQGKAQSGASVGPVSLGSLSDQVIRGMAEFLADRAQEEALRYLRDDLRKKLCEGDDESADVRKATFSNVCSALRNLDTGMSLEAMGHYLRAAAEKDLLKLPDLGLDYVEQKVPTHAPVAFSARVGLAFFEAVRQGRDPLSVLSSLGELQLRPCEVGACAATSKPIRFASAVTYALQQGGTEWHGLFDSGTLKPEDRPVVAVAVLLLAEARLKNLKAPRDLGFTLTFGQANQFLLDPLGLINDALSLVQSWGALEERLKKDLSDEARREAMADAMVSAAERATRMVETINRLSGTPNPNLPVAMERTREFVSVGARLVRRDYAGAAVLTLAQLEEAAPSKPLPAGVAKYLPLLVEIGTAQSSKDVAAAFDAYAAPLGTYKLKYKRPMVSINGLLGVHAGWERMDSKGVEGTSTIVAAFAPVGVHASHQVCDGLHLGVLLSVLDLGAVTTVKTDADDEPEGTLEGADPMTTPDAKAAAQIGFEQVFSPGAYLVAGIAGSPFVAGFGVSLSPELREVTQDGLETDVSVLRYGIFIAVDVPILPFQ